MYHNIFSKEGRAANWLWAVDGIVNAWKHPRQVLWDLHIASHLEMLEIKRMPVVTKLVFALGDEFVPSAVVSRQSKIKNLELEVLDRHHAWFFGHEKELVDKIVHFFNGNSVSTS